MTSVALITGVNGQDGSYLAELLLGKGYEVHGTVRATSDVTNLRHVLADVQLHETPLTAPASVRSLLDTTAPDEVYNLAGQSSVARSFDQRLETATSIGMLPVLLMEELVATGAATRFYQASSSEMFGASAPPQDEETPLRPVSPYGIAKVFAHEFTQTYRAATGLFACAGILFNHDSPRRPAHFVTRKITLAVAAIVTGRASGLRLGNVEVRRDWGHARDYVRAMHAMLQLDEATDLVVGTGQSFSVREFAERAFSVVGLDWQEHVTIDPELLRPADVQEVRADPSRARDRIGWTAETSFEELVEEMVLADVRRLETTEPVGPSTRG